MNVHHSVPSATASSAPDALSHPPAPAQVDHQKRSGPDFAAPREGHSRQAELSPIWDEAFVRVQSYLHAHQIQSALLLNQLATELIAEAQARAVKQSEIAPVTLAMQVTQERMAAWFKASLGETAGLDARLRARGRLALLMSNFSAKAPQDFLSPQSPQPDNLTALKGFQLQPGPEFRLSKMPPAELEFGFGDSDEAPAMIKWAIHPALGMCMVLFGAMGAAWAATH